MFCSLVGQPHGVLILPLTTLYAPRAIDSSPLAFGFVNDRYVPSSFQYMGLERTGANGRRLIDIACDRLRICTRGSSDMVGAMQTSRNVHDTAN